MAKRYVHTAFTLQHKGEKRHFPVASVVPDEVAEHWYVKAHTSADPIADPDTSAAADAMLAELDAKEKALAAREALVAESEAAAQARQADLDAREQALADREKAAQNAQSGAKEEKPSGRANASK